MTEFEPQRSRKETWGAFLEYADSVGVTIERIPEVTRPDGTVGPVDYLHRINATTHEEFFVPMPIGWNRERRLRYLMVEHLCERLKIDMPDWPIIL